jgi:hypothetical protein
MGPAGACRFRCAHGPRRPEHSRGRRTPRSVFQDGSVEALHEKMPASRARSSGKYLGSEATEERETDRGRGKKRGKKPRERERNEATRLFTPNHPTPPFSPITPSSPPPFHPRGHLLTPEALPRGRLPNRHVLEKFPRSPRW